MLTLNLVSVTGAHPPIECDSVHLTVCDDGRGKGGGSYGIRQGHAKALFSLGDGETAAYLNGEKIFWAHTSPGFATVDNDAVTLIIENYKLN